MTTRVPVGVFFALFTISGFAGLIYESIWSHYLKLFLGHAAYAQTLVLAIFMGGMALGSWLVSRFTQRIANLLLGYAIAELGIGLLAIVFHRVFQAATGWAFDTVLPALGGGGVDLFKWALASILILPASILLGTTFPLMSAGIIRLYPESSARALSMLYFTNSFGAALGVLASGFYLIDRFGLPGTILTAGLLNVALALAVWLITRRFAPAVAMPAAAPEQGEARGKAVARAILLLAFATGAASFIYEITWIRMLTLGLGASTHAFEVMLAAFILGMSLGAFWIRNRIGRLSNDIAWLAALLVAKAVFAIYALWVYGGVLEFIRWTMQATARTDGGYVLITLAGLVASMVVMLPTAFCAGITLPLATYALTSRGRGEASIGRVYGANTAGCIFGAAFATHLGMEWLGVKGLTGMGALLDVGVGALIYIVGMGAARRPRAYAVSGVAILVALIAFVTTDLNLLRMSSGVFRHGMFDDPATSAVRFYRDGKTATISVVDTFTKRSIRTNGKVDAAIELDSKANASIDEPTMVLAGALPLAMKPDAKLIANIGLGSGLTTHTLLGSAAVTEVDTIEIERMMVEGARLFDPANRRAFADPRSRIHIEDAKTFFAAHGKRYDVIVSEPSNPWVSGVSTLFSEEFYGQVKRYLRDDGLLVQWVQSYEINVGLLSSIFQALGKHFPDYAIYGGGRSGDLFVIATPAGKLPPLTAGVFAIPGLAADLARLGYRDLGDLNALRIGGRKALEPLFLHTGFPANSDFFPVIDQRAPRSRFKNESAEDVRRMRDALTPFLALLDAESRTPLARIQAAGRNRPVRIDRAVTGAEAIGIFLGGAAEHAETLSPELRRSALMARGLLDNCTGAKDAWIESLSDVVRAASPYLERADVAVVFERVQASRCWKSLDEPGRDRVKLLQAVNDRDAEAMATLGASLLQRKAATSDGERAFHLHAAMAGHLAKGRDSEARIVAERYFPILAPADREALTMHLLVAHALARTRDRAP
jgi:spermidine synthase